MNYNKILIGIGIVILIILVVLIPIKLNQSDSSENTKPIVDKGIQVRNQRYYGKKRILINEVPKKYEFPLGAKWAGWFDDPSKAVPFEVRYSLDGVPVLSNSDFSNHIPTEVIWVSKVPNTTAQYVTFMYTYD